MTCRICGSRCQGDRCADCERDAEAEARDAARERQARQEVESQQRGGIGDQDSSRCHRCRGDKLPCWDCLRAQGGDQ